MSARDSVAYINGKIYTFNKAQPWVEAFIVLLSLLKEGLSHWQVQ
jgi:hypothetical protein